MCIQHSVRHVHHAKNRARTSQNSTQNQWHGFMMSSSNALIAAPHLTEPYHTCVVTYTRIHTVRGELGRIESKRNKKATGQHLHHIYTGENRVANHLKGLSMFVGPLFTRRAFAPWIDRAKKPMLLCCICRKTKPTYTHPAIGKTIHSWGPLQTLTWSGSQCTVDMRVTLMCRTTKQVERRRRPAVLWLRRV